MRLHAPHAFAMGKRDVGSDAPTKVSLLSFLGKDKLTLRYVDFNDTMIYKE